MFVFPFLGRSTYRSERVTMTVVNTSFQWRCIKLKPAKFCYSCFQGIRGEPQKWLWYVPSSVFCHRHSYILVWRFLFYIYLHVNVSLINTSRISERPTDLCFFNASIPIFNKYRLFQCFSFQASYYIGLEKFKVVLCVQDVSVGSSIYGEKVSTTQAKDYNRGRSYLSDQATRSRVPVYSDIAEAVAKAAELAKE